jgi:quercetin 2,3-dioxygenase
VRRRVPSTLQDVHGITHRSERIARAFRRRLQQELDGARCALSEVHHGDASIERLESGPMITLRRANQRRHVRLGKHETWLTFYPQDRANPPADSFGALEVFMEDRLPPGARGPPHPDQDAEIVTYVLEGALAHEDSMGRSSVTQAGEFRRLTAGRHIRHSETNASRTDWAHLFQIRLHASRAGLEPSQERKRFSAAERRGLLRVVASPDGRNGSLHIQQDALIYSALLDPGQHLIQELSDGRSAWLHVVYGEATLGDVVLTTGDGAGVTADRAVSFTAQERTEILLLDLGQRLGRSATNGGFD